MVQFKLWVVASSVKACECCHCISVCPLHCGYCYWLLGDFLLEIQ